MQQNVGIWIDHRQAILVFVENKETHLKNIESGIIKPSLLSKSADSPHGAQSPIPEKTWSENHKQMLKNYYKNIIKAIYQVEKIFLFGPGYAKLELKKVLEEIKHFPGTIVKIETTDKITQPQIIAKVKAQFIKKK